MPWGSRKVWLRHTFALVCGQCTHTHTHTHTENCMSLCAEVVRGSSWCHQVVNVYGQCFSKLRLTVFCRNPESFQSCDFQADLQSELTWQQTLCSLQHRPVSFPYVSAHQHSDHLSKEENKRHDNKREIWGTWSKSWTFCSEVSGRVELARVTLELTVCVSPWKQLV